jgi:hypothetical protein
MHDLTELPAVAPHMHSLLLANCRLTGQLPRTWGNWSSMQDISLQGNSITGTLPESSSALSSLQSLSLTNNKLHGTLPWLWGQAQVMPRNLLF